MPLLSNATIYLPMQDSNDWEEGTFSDEELDTSKKDKTSQSTVKSHILHQILGALITLKTLDVSIYTDHTIESEPLPLNKIMFINNLAMAVDQSIKSAVLFRLYLKHKIPARLMVQVTNTAFKYIDVHTCYERSALRTSRGCVFLIDCSGDIRDVTFLCGVQFINHRLFVSLIMHLHDIYARLNLPCIETDFFRDDFTRLCNIVPKSITRIKIHPLYAIESILRPDQLIQPRRPIAGYIGGEPVLPRQNIVTLLTERQLYRNGLEVTSENPFRIVQKGTMKVSLYAQWQTKEIHKMGLGKGNMDYFHENHIPADCSYLLDEEGPSVCRLLDIEYRQCCVGFYKRMPVLKGIFVKSTDMDILRVAVEEFRYSRRIKEENEEMKRCLKLWQRLIKRTLLYKKIRERIGE